MKNKLKMRKASVSEARAGLIPSEETDATLAPKPKKNTKEKITWAKNEVDRLLDHVSPALLHKIVDERSKNSNPLIAFIEGGILQSLLRVDSTAPKGYRFAEYELVDYDVFDTEGNEGIKEIWDGFSPELQAYFRDYLKAEYKKFQERIAELCDCADRSWRGKEHDSACPLAGLPNPDSVL